MCTYWIRRTCDVNKPIQACISLLMGLKNGHGHWLCWMSTGSKKKTGVCEERTLAGYHRVIK